METMDSDESSGSDDVVLEVDVFLSKELAENLYLFHYPTKNPLAEEEDMNCLSARVKPKQQKVELEVGLNIHCDSYDKSRGEHMAYNVDGQSNSEKSYFQNSMMDKYTLSGTKACATCDSYALGFLIDGALHVTPIHSVLEIRPGFHHMDKIDNQSKKALETEAEVEEEEEAVAVTVRFEGANAERERKMRQKSFQFLQNKSASEPWVDVSYHKLGSSYSKAEYQKLVCPNMYGIGPENIFPEDYLKHLVPECLRLSGCQTATDEDSAILTGKPLRDQMTHLMINAHVMEFGTLMEKLPCKPDMKSVESLIEQIAVLVQGCWAVKSEILYPKNFISPFSGMNSKLLINARNYVLWLFTKSTFITRKEVLNAIYVPNEDFENMITPIATKTNRGWKFKFPYDKEFVESHCGIEQRQDIKWDLVYKNLVKDLNIGANDGDGDCSKTSHSPMGKPRVKRHSRSSMSEEGEESGTDSAPCGSHDSKRPFTPKKRTVPQSPTKGGVKSRPSFPIATLDISPTFLESPLPDTVKAELKDFLGEFVKSHFCVSQSELREALQNTSLANLLARGDCVEIVEEAILSYGALKLQNVWPQNTTPETLYAFCKFGNKLDRYRAALLDLFSTTARARMNTFIKKVEDELRERVSDADCRQIFEEYCIYKSGIYYLKGTVVLES